MSYNLVNPTTGALTRVSGNISSNIIPVNASANNKLVAKSDIIIKHNYSITGTTDAIADTKTLVNHILTLDAGTYAGEFKRTGITFGSYRLTYLPDGDGSISVSGTVTYSISNDNDSTYQVSYVLSSGTPTPYWNIEKLVTARENNFTFTTLPSPTDFNTVKTPGVYTFGVSEKDPYHAPIVGTFTLIVSCQNADWVQQLAIFNGDGKTFVRISSSGNWSDWEILATEDYTRNQNVLSNIETVTLPMTAPYDGELIAVASNGGYITFSINGSRYTIGSLTGLTSTSGLSIKKGDVLTLEALVGTAGFTARYYKLRDYSGR